MAITFWTGIVAGCSAVIGFSLNLIVILARFLNRKTKSAFQLLLVMLAFNDMILSILFAFIAALMYSDFKWIYPSFACKLLFPSVTTFMSVNVGCIFLVSYERYRAVTHPFKRRVSVKKTCLAVALLWFLGIIIIIPNVIALRMQPFGECRETWGDSITPKVYSTCMLLLVYLIPLALIITMHVRIGLRLRKASKDIKKHSNGSSVVFSGRKVKRNIKIIRVLVSITLAFSLFVLPTKIYYFVWDFTPQIVTEQVSTILDGYKSLYYAHVIVNPILYSLTDTEFRQHVFEIFRCKFSKRAEQSSGILT